MQRKEEASGEVVVLPIDGVGDDGEEREGRKAQAALGSRVTKLQPGWLEALQKLTKSVVRTVDACWS